MALFTPDDRQNLYAIFQPDEHEYRVMYTAGKDKEWAIYSVYIKRDAIINRLNEYFFGEWSSGFLNQLQPCEYHKDHVDCAMYMTIRGVRMEYNGSQAGTGENGAKGAATDAFKRIASQWGIGLYLQHAPTIMTKNPEKLDKAGKAAAERDVQNKITQWVSGLLAEQNQIVNISRPVSADPIIDEEEPPEVTEQQLAQWAEDVKTLVAPLYVDASGNPNPFHMKGSLNKAVEEGTINSGMRPFVAALHMLAHRAETDYGFSTEDLQAILGGQVGSVVKETPDSFANAWSIIRTAYTAIGREETA